MEDFFIWMYQLTHGIQDDPLWDGVYLYSGWFLIGMAIILLIIYYHIFNRFFINWFKLRHWFLFMVFNSILVAGVVTLIAISEIEPIEYGPEFLDFALLNFFLYAPLAYIFFSAFICLGSPHAMYTPFKFYSKIKRS